jgi:hypothetical protein
VATIKLKTLFDKTLKSYNFLSRISLTFLGYFFSVKTKMSQSLSSWTLPLTLLPNKKHSLSSKTHHMNVDYSGYEGWEVTGKVETVLLRGKIAINNNECKLQKGYGKFIKRKQVSKIL